MDNSNYYTSITETEFAKMIYFSTNGYTFTTIMYDFAASVSFREFLSEL
ncbi:hypothetical protein [Spirochaeta cellobiosiphila]|nr:hypothetical protein [Spirochaeta cellobiosiphila]